MRQFKDKGSTRINLDQITSYSKDFDITPPNGKTDTLILTIGSALRKMSYLNQEDRDADFKALDAYFKLDSDLR
jgi:hypothetical protein